MRLKKLHLRNFKGIRDKSITPDGASMSIFGDNATGKTTFFDALCWLLFDKDSRGHSTNYFSIKTKENGEVIHDIEHEVIGVFDNVTLRKVYSEDWVTKRGSKDPVMDGHTTKCYVDEVPVKVGEYKDAVSEIMDEERFRILTNPMYFPEEMHWSDRREVLLDLCGDIEQEDIIAGNDELLRYPEILGDKTKEQVEKILNERRKKLDKELDNIPGRIDELNGRLYTDVGNVPEARETVAELEEKKEAIQSKKTEVTSGGQLSEWKAEKRELEGQMQEARNEHQKYLRNQLSDQREKVSERQDKVDEAESDWREAKREYESISDEVDDAFQTVKNNKQDIEDIKDREPKPANAFEPEKCPVCEQTMPDAEEHDYEAYLEEFNEQKANDIKSAREKHEKAKEVHVDLKEELEETKEKASKAKGKLNQRNQALDQAEKKLEEMKADQADFEDTQRYEEITDDIDELDNKIHNYKQEKESQIEALEGEIAKIDNQLEEAQQTIHQAKENKRTRQRIAELQEEQQKYNEQLEQVEEDLYVIEQYDHQESKYISRAVNDMFDIVEWKLFEEQVNGGINSNVCEPIVDGIPYGSGLNDGHRIRAGIDIINTLAEHYDKSAPVFIDKAESVTSLPENDLQIIALVVSPADKELRFEQGLDHHLETTRQATATV